MKSKIIIILLFSVASVFSQWQQANGPYMGSVKCLSISGTNIFSGTQKNGIFISLNNGTSWSAINLGLPSTEVNSIIVSGSNIFAGTTNGIFLSTNNGVSWTASGLSNTGGVWSLANNGSNIFAGTASGVFLSTNNGTSWTAINSGLPSTDVNSISINGSNIFAGTVNGIFLSTNNGANWTSVNLGLPNNTNVLCLAISESNIYAGTYNAGVFLSTNNGTSWTAINSGMYITSVNSLAISGQDIFAGSPQGVYKSSNNGTSWTNVYMNMAGYIVNSLAISGQNIFAGTQNGIMLSTNNGINWTANTSAFPGNESVSAIIVKGSNIFAGTWNQVYRSTNNGTSWTPVNSGLGLGQLRCFAISGSNIFAGGDGGVYLSTNDGANWTAVNYRLPDDKYVVCLAANGSNIFAGTYTAGVFLSTNDGSSWTAVNSGLNNNNYIISLAASGSNILAGTYTGGVFLSTNNGTSWTTSGLNSSVWCFATNGSNIYAVSSSGFNISTNNGTSWNSTGTATPGLNHSLVINGSNIFAAVQDKGVYLSTNGGVNWTAINTGFPDNTHIVRLAINGPYLFAGATNNNIGGLGMWRRALSEITFYNISTVSNPIAGGTTIGYGSYLTGTNVTVTASPNNGYKFTNWTENGSIVSTSSSYSFTLNGDRTLVANFTIQLIAPTAIPPTSITQTSFTANWNASTGATGYFLDVARDIAFSNPVYGYIGKFVGNVTSALVSGLTASTTYYYRVRAFNTQGESANSNTITVTVLTGIKELEGEIPITFKLFPNYPNPFNPSSIISFALPKASKVSLKVYDLIGKEITTLLDKELSAGYHDVSFDGSTLPSGIYLYRIQANGFVQSRKMVLLLFHLYIPA